MADSKDIVERLTREHAVSRTTSRIAAGRSEQAARPAAPASDEQIDAINQVFALFRLNYHNQYYAAYPDSEQLTQIKRLWLDALADYPVAQILQGARVAIETSEYLPTLHRMLECCRQGLRELGLPGPREAYVEACNAQAPRSAQPWSHPAVYLAGRDTGWFFLAGSEEQATWPVFRRHYQRWCDRVMAGETLEIPAPAALEQQPAEPLSREEQKEQLRRLREQTGI
jgi:hypothetical protein